MIEALVITACMQNKGGCTEGTSAYYSYNKDVKAAVERVEEYGKSVFKGKEWLIYVITPVYSVSTGKPANFTLYRGLILSLDVKQQTVAFKWSY